MAAVRWRAGMPRTSTSIFGEPEDFEAALSGDGIIGLLVTGEGKFRARLTQVALEEICLTAGEEEQPRCAFALIPDNMVLIVLPTGKGPWPVWGGITIGANQVITIGPSERLHVRTSGLSRWGSLRISVETLARYNCALMATPLLISGISRWRPQRTVLRNLLTLYRAAIYAAEARSSVIVDADAAHVLEQQLIHTLIECLSSSLCNQEPPADRQHRGILAQFEDMISDEPERSISDICAALHISEAMLRACCRQHLGMSPGCYRRLRSKAGAARQD